MHPQVETLLERARSLPAQRTDEWLKERNTMVTASEIGGVLLKGGYKTALKNKVGSILGQDHGIGQAFKGNVMTQWGTDNEDAVRDRFCREYNEVCHETGCLRHPVYSFMGASPDGILESGSLLEIKCPYSRVPKMGVVPKGYLDQMQMQMEVCGLNKCYYVEWQPSMCFEIETDTFLVQVIDRDPEWLRTNLETIERFWSEVVSYVSDPDRARVELTTNKNPRKKPKEDKQKIWFV